MNVFITGGAGFIGSNLVDKLIDKNYNITVYDNLSTGQIKNIEKHLNNPKFNFINADLLDTEQLNKSMKNYDIVFHFAANADVRNGIENTKKDFDQNILATYNVLESIKINGIKKVVFASSSAVYGDPKIFPTPENSELIQTSIYGASKLAGESMIQAYCEYYNIQSWTFRFVSWIGKKYSHGVIFDFMKKLKTDSTKLEILGDGKQKKSYLDVQDGVEGILYALENFNDKKNIVNLGHEQMMNVIDVANIVCEELKLKNVKYVFTGGERGWIGDAPFVHLDISKLKNAGWAPKVSITDGIKNTVTYLKNNEWLLAKR